MTVSPEGLSYHRYRAPQENGRVLMEPPLAEAGRVVAENLRRRAGASYDFQGRGLPRLIADARAELLSLARRWTAAYRPELAASGDAEGLIFLAGHQPELFHPGVWLKNFALGALARRHQATAINLVIDSDTTKGLSLRVPGGSPSRPRVELIALDRPEPRVPYEERRVIDRRQFEDFGGRVAAQMAPLLGDPLVLSYWPLVRERLAQTDHLGACIAQARHQWEGRWGLETLEVPQSWVCEAPSFCWFAVHLLAQLPRFRRLYNEAVQEYRRVHRIRNAVQPMPDLAAEGPWLEAPLWVWTAERPVRRRLLARQDGRELILSDRQGWEARLALSPESDGRRAAEQLAELRQQGVKIRSRALITTLWARLVLGNLFLHGIGGAKYDQVTNLLMERFFGLAAPGMMVVSATLHLPVSRPAAGDCPDFRAATRSVGPKMGLSPLVDTEIGTASPAAVARQLRELAYHPERFLPASAGENQEVAALLAAKERWIHASPTPQGAHARWQAIRQINEALQGWLSERRRQLVALQAQTAQESQAAKILAWREYGFCLYPEAELRNFLDGLLPKNC